MSNGVKETMCTSCIHLPVCSLKETFLKAQQAVDDACFSEPNYDKTTRITYVVNLREWIEPPKLRCRHYIQQQIYRNINSLGGTQSK